MPRATGRPPESQSKMALELINVTKRVGAQLHIKETSLVLEPGHFNVLLGATGSGKTSLLNILAGKMVAGAAWLGAGAGGAYWLGSDPQEQAATTPPQVIADRDTQYQFRVVPELSGDRGEK